VVTSDPSGHIYISGGDAFVKADGTNGGVRFWPGGSDFRDPAYAPKRLDFDVAANPLIWTCPAGIATIPTTRVVTTPGYVAGQTLLAEDQPANPIIDIASTSRAAQFLFTRFDDPKVYWWDRSAANASSSASAHTAIDFSNLTGANAGFNFAGYIPREMRKGNQADQMFIELYGRTQNSVTAVGLLEFWTGVSHYKILKTHLTTTNDLVIDGVQVTAG